MVYIDNYNKKYARMTMCHMIADTEQELYEMVDKIGIQRKWKHNNHYDICLSKKQLAIKNGAIEIETLELAKIWYLRKMREKRKLKRVPIAIDLKNLSFKDYFKNEKERIRNENT